MKVLEMIDAAKTLHGPLWVADQLRSQIDRADSCDDLTVIGRRFKVLTLPSRNHKSFDGAKTWLVDVARKELDKALQVVALAQETLRLRLQLQENQSPLNPAHITRTITIRC